MLTKIDPKGWILAVRLAAKMSHLDLLGAPTEPPYHPNPPPRPWEWIPVLQLAAEASRLEPPDAEMGPASHPASTTTAVEVNPGGLIGRRERYTYVDIYE